MKANQFKISWVFETSPGITMLISKGAILRVYTHYTKNGLSKFLTEGILNNIQGDSAQLCIGDSTTINIKLADIDSIELVEKQESAAAHEEMK